MQNTFCKSLSNAVSFRLTDNRLTFNPCCLYNQQIPFHPVVYKKQQEAFDNVTDFIPNCSKCKLKEATTGISLRTISNETIPDGIGNDIYKLEIVLDTTCNAACIQCDPQQSSLWRKAYGEVIHIQPESQIDNSIELIKQSIDISRVRHFHFWGGEPLLTDTHLKFLREVKDLSQVHLLYSTNGSIFPDDETLYILKKVESFQINISMDGIGDQFHYMRWPLGWDKITNNIQRFKELGLRNGRYGVNCCVTPINAFYIDEIEAWVEANMQQILKRDLFLIRGEGPLDLSFTPPALREAIYNKFGQDHPVSKMVNAVSVKDPKNMIAYLDKWDAVRNENWRKIFPESAKYM